MRIANTVLHLRNLCPAALMVLTIACGGDSTIADADAPSRELDKIEESALDPEKVRIASALSVTGGSFQRSGTELQQALQCAASLDLLSSLAEPAVRLGAREKEVLTQAANYFTTRARRLAAASGSNTNLVAELKTAQDEVALNEAEALRTAMGCIRTVPGAQAD